MKEEIWEVEERVLLLMLAAMERLLTEATLNKSITTTQLYVLKAMTENYVKIAGK